MHHPPCWPDLEIATELDDLIEIGIIPEHAKGVLHVGERSNGVCP